MNLIPQADIVDSINLAAGPLSDLFHGAVIAPLDSTGWIQVTGEDRVRWLNGMVTNSIQDLKPDAGNFNFVLNAQGRIQGTLTAFAQPESLLLETDRAQLAHLTATLDRFIIMDDVELKDISDSHAGFAMVGTQAAGTLERMGLSIFAVDPTTMKKLLWRDTTVTLIAAESPLVPRFELWGDHKTIDTLKTIALGAGATVMTAEALEALRILEGTPRYGTDIRDKELPQETAQTRALHFAKGCYLGQEIVERIRSRGNVHRTFTGFRLEGELPATGTLIESDGKLVGELTSVTAIPLTSGVLPIALGYIRREALERGAVLTYPGGHAVAVSLPFRELSLASGI